MTLAELIATIKKPIASVDIMNYCFDTVFRGNVENIPTDLLNTDYADAYHDIYGMDGIKNRLSARLYL